MLLSACGDGGNDTTRRNSGTQDADALPAPQRSGGSVTGMPAAPGPGTVPIGGPAPESLPGPQAGSDSDLPPLEDNPETGLLAADTTMTPQPAPAGLEQAVSVVRDYYAAINARDYARAYSLWSDGGRSSGQSPQQFSEAFAETAGITVQIGEAADAGGRFVEVPVTLTATRRSGEVRRFLGSYSLRRAGADASGQWRIAAADLREIQP